MLATVEDWSQDLIGYFTQLQMWFMFEPFTHHVLSERAVRVSYELSIAGGQSSATLAQGLRD